MLLTLPTFRLHRPRTLAAALALLHEHGPEARVLAGGTDLVVNLRQRLEEPAHVVALAGVAGLGGVRFAPGEGLRLGAMASVAERFLISRRVASRVSFSALG